MPTIISGVFQAMVLVSERCLALVGGEQLAQHAWQLTTRTGFLLSGVVPSTKCSNQVTLVLGVEDILLDLPWCSSVPTCLRPLAVVKMDGYAGLLSMDLLLL